MNKELPTKDLTPAERDERTLRKALELSRRESLPESSLEEMLSHVPEDWKPGEFDVDEFLSAIRPGRVKK